MSTLPPATARRFHLAFDPDVELENCPMKFRLTYEGQLLASTGSDPRAKHKQEIRKAFHPQLKRLWEVEPNLVNWEVTREPGSTYPKKGDGLRNVVEAWRVLADMYERVGYKFVPIATADQSLIASVEILFLRPDVPGSIIRSGDIDNRLKTLFDALRMPTSKGELGGYDAPALNETPFYVLLEDDRLLSHVSVETDVLLQPTPSANGQFVPNDARLIITVNLKPYAVRISNLHFAS